MNAKVFFSALAVIAIAGLAQADPERCADPSAAVNLVLKAEIHEEAPATGSVEKLVTIPTPKAASCVVLTGLASYGPSGHVAITAVSFAEDSVGVRVVSDIETGIDGQIEVYTE